MSLTTLSPKRVEACRASGSAELIDVLSFPPLPIAGTYLSPGEEGTEALLPLTVAFCPVSGLAQLREIFPPEIYAGYKFVGTSSGSYVAHLDACAAELVERHGARGKRVLEIGCSNGYLLGKLRDLGRNEVFGYEPSTELQKATEASGIPSVNAFFSTKGLAHCPFDKADAIVIRHVLEHIDDLTDFVEAVDRALAPDGVLVVEVPDLRSILDRKLYAHFYHEHVNYFSLESLSALFAARGLTVVDHRIVEIHSGSLYAVLKRASAGAVAAPGNGRDPITLATCQRFADDLWRYFDRLGGFLRAERAKGTRMAGYGAAHRATVMCGLARIGRDEIDYLVDKNPYLNGLVMPETHLPIRSPEALLADPPDAVPIFATSFEAEILREQRAYIERGGRFISLLPEPRHVDTH